MIEIELKRIADALEMLVAMTPTYAPADRAEAKPEVPPGAQPASAPAAMPTSGTSVPVSGEPKRGRGRPPKTETTPAPAPPPPPPAPAPAPAPAEPEDSGDDWGDEPAKPTKQQVLDAMLAYKARLVAAKEKAGVEKKQAEADSHRETGALLLKAAGVKTLTELPEAKYADVVKAASA